MCWSLILMSHKWTASVSGQELVGDDIKSFLLWKKSELNGKGKNENKSKTNKTKQTPKLNKKLLCNTNSCYYS